MSEIQKIKSLHKLTANVKTALEGRRISGLNVPDFLARLEDRQAELVELEGLAGKIETNRAVAQALDDLLGQKELESISHDAHRVILAKKHAVEKTIEAQEKQLGQIIQIEKGLVADAVMIQAATIAQERGCLNAKLVGLYIADQAQAEFEDNGKLSVSFAAEDGTPLLNKVGRPMTVEDAVGRFADENPSHFDQNAIKSKRLENPWLPGQINLTLQGEILKKDPALARLLQADAGKPAQANVKRTRFNGNPWKAESFNLTEQGRLIRENLALARKLASEAGVTLGA